MGILARRWTGERKDVSKLEKFERRVRTAGLLAGPILALTWVFHWGLGMPADSRVVLGMAICMAVWWMTEAVPLAATSLLPLLVLPLFTSIGFKSAAAPYASSIVFLFMGGFMLGLAMQRWGLHRRLALGMLIAVGSGQRRLVGGFMLTTALLSMWLSNTATTMMLLPIGMSVVETYREELERSGEPEAGASAAFRSFSAALILGIAYAASIGGMGTQIGTPPNLIMSGYMREHYQTDLSMIQWMRVGVPVLLLLLPVAWAWLSFGAFRLRGEPLPGGSDVLRVKLRELGPMSPGERCAGTVFLLVALCWVFRPQLAALTGLSGLDDAVIALVGALLLFVLPAGLRSGERVLDWDSASRLPWDILLLFGGGLSLAAAITASGADAPLADMLGGLAGVPGLVMMLILGTVIVFSGELTSNTAAATAMMPILAALCAANGLEPLPVFMVATLTGSCGFMLPVATPPNAIAYGSGHVQMGAMIRAGLGLNLICIALIVCYVWFIAF